MLTTLPRHVLGRNGLRNKRGVLFGHGHPYNVAPRHLTTSQGKDDPKRNEEGKSSAVAGNSPPATPSQLTISPFVTSSVRGMGQVVFCNNTASGALVTLGLACCHPVLGSMALLGCVSSTATAAVASESPPDNSGIQEGLAGYNGALVGCAFAVFLDVDFSTLALATLVGGAGSTALYSALATKTTTFSSVGRNLPQLTLAFNGVALTVLSFTRPLSSASEPAADSSSLTETASQAATTSAESLEAILATPLTGLAQIYVSDSAIFGATLLAALALQESGSSYGRSAAAHALAGSCLGGTISYTLLGMPLADVTAGLGGFNPALSALAMHVFCQPSAASYALALGAAGGSAVVSSVMAPVAVGTLGIPVCTVPFCVTTLGSLAMVKSGLIPGVRLR